MSSFRRSIHFNPMSSLVSLIEREAQKVNDMPLDADDVGVPINQDVMVNTLNSYGVTDMTNLLLKEPSQPGIIGTRGDLFVFRV